MERTVFLARVRTALAGVEGPSLPAAWPPTPASAPDASSDRFLAALVAVAGTGALVGPHDVAGAVEAFAREHVPEGRRTAVVTSDLGPFLGSVEEGLGAAGVEVARPEGATAWRAAAERAGIGITSARLGVAATGSVLIASGSASPRTASILPENHLVVLPVDRLVPGLDDAMPVVASLVASHSAPLLVTGPSRTSDIEMQMVLGAHGPRAVHVLLVRPG